MLASVGESHHLAGFVTASYTYSRSMDDWGNYPTMAFSITTAGRIGMYQLLLAGLQLPDGSAASAR